MNEVLSENLIASVEAHLQNQLEVSGIVNQYDCSIQCHNQGEDIVIMLRSASSKDIVLYYNKKTKRLLAGSGFLYEINDDVPEVTALNLLQEVAANFKLHNVVADQDAEAVNIIDETERGLKDALSSGIGDQGLFENSSHEKPDLLKEYFKRLRWLTIDDVIAKTLPIILRYDPLFQEKIGISLNSEIVHQKLQSKGRVRAAYLNGFTLKYILLTIAQIYSRFPTISDDDREFLSSSIRKLQRELGLRN